MENAALDKFKLLTTHSVGREVSKIREAFDKKHKLENVISKLIKDYENETGLAIDCIHYQRDITLPIQGARYTSLSILIIPEEENKL